MASYKYQKLETDEPTAPSNIRILTLQPGSGSEPIHCQLRVSRLEEVTNNGTYESLSYCWGIEPANMSIFLHNEDSEDSTFDVRPNLFYALSTFRNKERPRDLWIDAICINQDDDAEKSKQVPLMRRIYEGSIGTLIWLGTGTAGSQSAMNLVRALKSAWMGCGGNIPKISAFNSNELRDHGLPSLLSSDYVNLLTMLEQPWFGRAWIVQEVTVSKTAIIYWGNEFVDWKDLVMGIDFALRAELPFALHPAPSRFLSIAEEAEYYKGGNCKLISVLLRHRPCQATVPLDKVYAFLGLTERGHENFISVNIDYQQSPATFFTDIARRIAEHDQSLDILSLPATPLRSSISELPTWVPDWTSSSGQSLRQAFNGEGNSLANAEGSGRKVSKPFSAAGITSYSLKPNPSNSILVVDAHKFDEIVTAAPQYETLHLPSSVAELGKTASSLFRSRSIYMQWEDSIRLPHLTGIPQKYPTGEDLVDAFFQTLMVGNIATTDNKAQLREDYIAWSRTQRPAPILDRFKLGYLQTAVSAVKTLTSSVIMKDMPTTFQKRIKDVIFRRLVRTAQGYIGLCSGDVKVGDQIWLVKGSKVPIVLREDGGDEAWAVIGDAYVHGIMYGEGFDEAKCGEIFLK